MTIDVSTRKVLVGAFQELAAKERQAALSDLSSGGTHLAYAGMMANIAERFADTAGDNDDLLAFLTECSFALNEQSEAAGLKKNIDGSIRIIKGIEAAHIEAMKPDTWH